MKVLVLAGGPDRERPVSLKSGAQVAAALREAGHEVRERDMGPGDVAALAELQEDPVDVVFPVFHGKWGEGGGCQLLLEAAGVAFVGCGSDAARRCFDKSATKWKLESRGLPTPEWELMKVTGRPTLEPPVVIKPNDEGSSIDLRLCRDAAALESAWAELAGSGRHEALLVERMIVGREMTVGVVVDEQGKARALPSIRIVPATEFYDYQAKYERDDTRYEFDAVDPAIEAQLRHLAEAVFAELGCRHLARVDLFLDADDRPWVIEVNTLPGFTDHSLLPMAAKRSGLALPALVDRLVRLAAAGG